MKKAIALLLPLVILTGCSNESEYAFSNSQNALSVVSPTLEPVTPEEASYLSAVQKFTDGSFKEAQELFQQQPDYKDSADYLKKLTIIIAVQGTWQDDELKSYKCIISGWMLYSVGGSVYDFPLTFNESGELIYTNHASQPQARIAINEEGKLTAIDVYGTPPDMEIFSFISDSTELPVIKKEPSIGMTADEVRDSTWGSPKKINQTITAYGKQEQWVYDNGKYIYLDNGIVTTIQK